MYLPIFRKSKGKATCYFSTKTLVQHLFMHVVPNCKDTVIWCLWHIYSDYPLYDVAYCNQSHSYLDYFILFYFSLYLSFWICLHMDLLGIAGIFPAMVGRTE